VGAFWFLKGSKAKLKQTGPNWWGNKLNVFIVLITNN
jgi:hypothetical protein